MSETITLANIEAAFEKQRDLPDHSDSDLNPHWSLPTNLQEASVLIPVVERPEGLTILLTKRAADLKVHAGQISFPGGKREVSDPCAKTTALRELQEETAITQVKFLGTMPLYRTQTGFVISPFVGLLPNTIQPIPDPTEVAEIFEPPLSFLLNPNNYGIEEIEIRGGLRRYYVIRYKEYYIWGATAGMLFKLAQLIASTRKI